MYPEHTDFERPRNILELPGRWKTAQNCILTVKSRKDNRTQFVFGILSLTCSNVGVKNEALAHF